MVYHLLAQTLFMCSFYVFRIFPRSKLTEESDLTPSKRENSPCVIKGRNYTLKNNYLMQD